MRDDSATTFSGTNVWEGDTDEKKAYHFRLCMEFGKSAHYKTERDRLRFVHYNNLNEWETLAESASALPDDEKEAYNTFCQARAQDSVIDRSDTGIVVRGGSYDKAARTASV